MIKPPVITFLDKYRRVDADCPCPVCGHTDWCLIQRNGRQVVCARVESGKRFGEAGWIHSAKVRNIPPAKQKVYLSPAQIRASVRGAYSTRHDPMFVRHAKSLGLPLAALLDMRAGYDDGAAALVFPLFDRHQQLAGVLYRRMDGRKWFLRGGRAGVYLGRNFTLSKPIWISEGPTDGAALIALGFDNVLGRFNRCHGMKQIVSMVGESGQPVVIVSDADEAGRANSVELANRLPNPTAVIAGKTDIREYFKKNKNLTKDVRATIIKSLQIDHALTTEHEHRERADWYTIHKNMAGRVFDFAEVT